MVWKNKNVDNKQRAIGTVDEMKMALLCKGHLRKETEPLLIATMDKCIRNNCFNRSRQTKFQMSPNNYKI